ncbi:DUF349 domain-containing protein [Oceanobacter mangrovi]|uniref:DUF349 domain-containing protein n=1 Tax=Oceanobacter mangrovi TaxID=2862510 RepID=UPI001C8DE6E2|nr:DUF349 domain-containing protein [Oceanobacter mangrovi]
MSLLKKFLKPGKPKWQHDDPAVRKQALADLPHEQILQFIDIEPSAELRLQAVQRLSDEAVLEKLLAHNHDDVREAARNHWLGMLMPAGKDLASISVSATLVRIAGLTRDDELRLQAIARITDQQERLAIARQHPVARVRLTAAEGIDDYQLLQQLLDHAQGKDKAVYRLCKDRLAAAKAAADAKAEQQQKIQNVLEQAAYLNRIGYGPEFNGRLQVLTRQREEFASAMDADQQARLDSELQQARAVLQQHEQEEQRRADAERLAAAAQQRQLELLEQLQQVVKPAAAADQLQQSLHEIDSAWHSSLVDHKPEQQQLRLFENTLQQGMALHSALASYNDNDSQLEQWLQQDLPADMKGLQQVIRSGKDWLGLFKWPADLPQPEWLAALRGKCQLAEAQLANLQDQQTARIDQIDQQLSKLEKLLDEGHLKDASKFYGQVNHALRQIDHKSAQRFQHRIKAVGARLSEMRDWQGYVTTPKKEALCEEMEALIGVEIAPESLANKIQALQEEWKTLNTSQPDKELWERFQIAGDKAFEPCRAWYAEAAQQRELNITLRNQLIDELSQYEANLDWSSADWKVVQKTLEAARETFRGYSPVERGAHRDTQSRFHSICDKIYAHLKAEYDRNLATKSSLADTAAQLLQQEDLTGVVDQIKQLQQQWKQVGVTPRAADQKLWRQFRSNCDAIFARLDEQRAERKSAIDHQVSAAEALVQQAQALLDSDIADDELQQQLQQIEQEFAAVELPRGAHQRLRKALSDVANTLHEREEALLAEEDRQRWQGLLDNLVAIANADETQWQQAEALPEGYSQKEFEQRWQQAGQFTNASAEARDLCIRMEILAEQESPASDQNRRMELQVQRLAEAMGQAVSRDAERASLVSQWLLTSSDTDQQQRFLNALQASL